MVEGDLEGKFKVSWDAEYLYVLVEVVDNMISDDYTNPLQNWWDDDCLEVFLDEDRSKGNHERTNNAFAYHVSIFYDAIDLDAAGKGVNYKQNISVIMDTIAPNTYMWEMAIKVYDSKFSLSNPEASRVTLAPKKLMGFTIAYCDNDETKSRENFIGSMFMSQATANDNYKTADYFGSMLLVDKTDITLVKSVYIENSELARIYPNPVNDLLTINLSDNVTSSASYSIHSMIGTLLKSGQINTQNQNIDVDDLIPGIYFLTISVGKYRQIERIIKY